MVWYSTDKQKPLHQTNFFKVDLYVENWWCKNKTDVLDYTSVISPGSLTVKAKNSQDFQYKWCEPSNLNRKSYSFDLWINMIDWVKDFILKEYFLTWSLVSFHTVNKYRCNKYKGSALPMRILLLEPLNKFLKKAVTCLIITDESLANSILGNLVMHPIRLNVISNICTSLHSKGIWFSIIAHAASALNRSTILLLCVTVQRMERLVLCGRGLVGQDTELSRGSGKSTRMFSKLLGKKGPFTAQVT